MIVFLLLKILLPCGNDPLVSYVEWLEAERTTDRIRLLGEFDPSISSPTIGVISARWTGKRGLARRDSGHEGSPTTEGCNSTVGVGGLGSHAQVRFFDFPNPTIGPPPNRLEIKRFSSRGHRKTLPSGSLAGAHAAEGA